ncbi:hypothetical protein J7J47_03950 [Halomonas sp. ISL-60]|uniref:hypothetical protein n=1 Tax=Halomonas sp. ISL-56 TaxID=2819149 RepID=UPI001BECCFA7|nr:hypothetical protein [Halomonas sp. ISL-56]MBT2771384.1 hypothetical protein [Halomonas sp. ISL-60]MBT2801551.1 hypothetical protein [Halomonas sp. ISL-56]
MTELSRDHTDLADPFASRRYFRKFEHIIHYLARTAVTLQAEGRLTKTNAKVLTDYLIRLNRTFKALSMKYLLVGNEQGPPMDSLTMDKRDSGFPVASELLTMGNDVQQAALHLANLPSEKSLKKQMLHTILTERQTPTKLQFALSQRLYYETLTKGGLFWARNDPSLVWQGTSDNGRRQFLIHWAVYDSQVNLPVIYLVELEDSGKTPLPQDQSRWPQVQSHLMSQSLVGLKLLTIAQGFDKDFSDLHPKQLSRYHLGPMYSSAYTEQSGPLHQVLEQAATQEGQDWALAWTLEELNSEQVREERAGWFSKVEREVFALDPFGSRGVDTGATRTERAIILPQHPFQVLAELDPPGFLDVRKFVVSPKGQVLGY